MTTPVADAIEARMVLTEGATILDNVDAARLLGVFRLVERFAVTGQMLQRAGRRQTRPGGPVVADPVALAAFERAQNLLCCLIIPLFTQNLHAVDNVLNATHQDVQARRDTFSGPRCMTCDERPPCDPKGCAGCTHDPECPR